MKTLKIEGSIDSPEIILDSKNSTFSISGRSLPEDGAKFYAPVFSWLNQYQKEPNLHTEFVFNFDYMNSSSYKLIQEILKIIGNIHGAKIIWYFDEEDEDMENLGADLSELQDIPFEFRKQLRTVDR
jgi:hypothetical protein